MTHSRRTTALGAFILALFLTHNSFAEPPLLGEPESTVKLASEKLLRGLVNAATGVGEIIRQPIVCTIKDGGVGVPVGIINGAFMSVVRTGAGILDVFTFPLPLDASIGYGSTMNPEYVWQRTN